MDRVSFTQMKDGTKEEYEFLTAHEIDYTKGTADRLLQALEHLDEGLSGYQITRLSMLPSSFIRWANTASLPVICCHRRMATSTYFGSYSTP